MGRSEDNQTLGSFEELVVRAILKLGSQAYGGAIHELLQEVTGRPIVIGGVYMALERLKEKGLVDFWRGDPTPERGGRAKKFFHVTGEGEKVLRQIEGQRASLAPSPSNACGRVLKQ